MSKTAEEDPYKTGLSNPDLKPLHSDWLTFSYLTILFHPQLRLIGARCVLVPLEQGELVALSRTQPRFRTTNRGSAESLAISAISRQPLQLVPAPNNGVRILLGDYSMPVKVNGIPLQTEALVSAEDVRAGVVLTLSETVVLLLHRSEMHLVAEERSQVLGQEFGLVGKSTALVRLYTQISSAAQDLSPVLLRGETGSGKELVAAAIHGMSKRQEKPMVTVNMAGFSPTLAPAAFFGAEKGAFTGAAQRQVGLFREAHESTLFLDEIGDTPEEMQALLLRALETGTVRALGSGRDETVDVRIIAATDADLDKAMEEGRFRAPFYHRLAGHVIRVPPLRERRDDIGRLLVHFLVQELTRLGKEPAEIEVVLNDRKQGWLQYEHVAPLFSYSWPGNVRELRNRVRQIVLAVRTGQGAELPAMPVEIGRQEGATSKLDETGAKTEPDPPPAPTQGTKKRRRRKLTDEAIEAALSLNKWEIAGAAASLKCSRQWLYDRIRASPRLPCLDNLSDEEILAAYHACGGDIDQVFRQLRVSRPALIRRLSRILRSK